MIKHTELRCGNKVHISGKEDLNERLVATVGEIHYFGSTLECDFGKGEGEEDCDIDHEDLIPIPLSEEWLIRAGAESSVFDNRKQYFLRKFGRLIIYQDGQFHEYATRVKLPFVHTLQNFIFVISDGEELTFKDL